jgi:multicomponent Na+:H+ antiporter subunit D
MINAVHPALIFYIGALLLPLLKVKRLKQIFQIVIPVVAFTDLLYMTMGNHWIYKFMQYDLILGRVDKLSMCFAYVFVIATILGMVYALHIKESGQHSIALIYAGSALGLTFAGDFITVFAFWEAMAVSSVFLIMYQKGERALNSGFRYLMVHLFGGACLLAGIIIYVGKTGSTQFTQINFGDLSSYLILLGFIINAAVPPFHAWLPDSYPEASVTGSVFLSAFTTKSAVYVLMRGFPGVELLVWLGAIMAIYGIVYAVLENDIRRLLAYHIISQVGYMVCGVGLGTEMALNGSAAHAFSHILYKALLFMGVGAVIEVTGKNKMTELQGRDLYKKMPICLSLYMVGAFSISAAPLFNGFVSKTMIVYAAGEIHRPIIHLMLHLASIGTFLHTGLKLPYGTWFGKKTKGMETEEIQAKEPPLNMLIAMGMTAFVCIFTGVYPKVIYDLLPYKVTFHPYTLYAVLGMIQLLLFTALAFWFFINKLGGEPTISLDTDWFYRKGGLLFVRFCEGFVGMRSAIQIQTTAVVRSANRFSINPVQGLRSVFVAGKWLPATPYGADRYRQPIGIGIMFFLILFSLYCLLFFNF